SAAGVVRSRLDLGHAEILRAILAADPRGFMIAERVYPLLQSKSRDELAALKDELSVSTCKALVDLSTLYGGVEVLARARDVLPRLPRIASALEVLECLAAALEPARVSIDLADLRGYHYHNGVVFAAYFPGFPGTFARGGRYDGVGEAFGRARPATGFSLDLREIARLSVDIAPSGAILAPPVPSDGELRALIADLRARGEIVVDLLPGEADQNRSEGLCCDRRLVKLGGHWTTQTIIKD
ncbi:MAG: ATP phosphoribosyltransferase regulatory subunit, partial [Propionivibrio sp.]